VFPQAGLPRVVPCSSREVRLVKEKTDTGVPAVPGPVPGTRMTEQYIRDIGRMAYLWAWPMVKSLRR
jgi:hypothetical protein